MVKWSVLAWAALSLAYSCESPKRPNASSAGTEHIEKRPTTVDTNDYFDYSLLASKHLEVISAKYAEQGSHFDTNVRAEILLLRDTTSHPQLIIIRQYYNQILKINNNVFSMPEMYGSINDFLDGDRKVEFMEICKGILFSHKEDVYLVVYSQTWAFPTTMPNTYASLFRFDGERVIHIFSKEQCCETIYCFNDFNHDGKLDFAYWRKSEGMKIRSLTIENDSLIEDTAHYVILETDSFFYKFKIAIDKWHVRH